MQIVKIHNPFQRQLREIETIEYLEQTVEEILFQYLVYLKKKSNIDILLQEAKNYICISLNGLIIPPEFWGATVPRENDQIVFMPIVGKGGDDKNILNAIIMIAVIVTGQYYLAPALGLTGAGAIAIFTAGLTIGTGLLISSLTPSPQMGNLNLSDVGDWGASQVYGWSPQTTQKQGVIIPKFYGKNKLWGNVVAVHTEVDATDDSKQNLKVLVALGSGPVQGIVAGTIKINGQNVSNFSAVSTEERKGTLNQSIISFFGDTKPEYRPSRVVKYGTPVIYTTPDADFDSLEIEIWFTRGLYYANDQGGLSNHNVTVKVEISENEAEVWSTLAEENIMDKTTSPKRKSYDSTQTYTGGSPVTITNGTKYDIKITKTTYDHGGARYGDELRFGSVREVINDDFIHPGVALLGIDALATDQLSGALRASCVQEGAIVNTYDGSSWNLEYSNNPAWVLWDVLTQPVISGDGSSANPYTIERYDGMSPARLDAAQFYVLAQFCDVTTDIDDGEGGNEKRITFNGGFDIETTRWTAALKVCEIARCALVWNGIELTVAIDTVATPVQMFTVSNIIKDSFKESFLPQNELIGEIEIHYRDEKQDYKRVPFTILESNIVNSGSRATMGLFGITKQTEAWRAAMFRLAQNRYLKSFVEFDVDIDAIACTIGDVIYVQHDVPEWGFAGRVVSGTTLSFITDKDIEYISGVTHTIYVRKKDDNINEKTTTSTYNAIRGVNQEAKQFEINGSYRSMYLSGDRIKAVDTTGNDGIYTLASNSTYHDGVTTITVNEAIPNDPFSSAAATDGGLYNLRRVVVGSTFKDIDNNDSAPEAGDVYSFGIQNLHAREYRIIGLRKTSEQIIHISAVEYNALIYGNDILSPIITPQQATDIPEADDIILIKPISKQAFTNLLPPQIRGGPIIDIPLTTNLTWVDGDSGSISVSWNSLANDSAGNYPIYLSYQGITYVISDGTSDKEFIYWDLSNPTVFQDTNTLENAVGVDKWIMCKNDNGVSFPSWGVKVFHAAIIQANTITADKYLELRNTYVYTAEKNLDGTYPFEMPFKIVSELNAIISIKLSFQIKDYQTYSGSQTANASNGTHNHSLNYGVRTVSGSPTIHYHVDNGSGYGNASDDYTTDQLDIDISSDISGAGWKGIKFDTDIVCRISAIIECKLDIDA